MMPSESHTQLSKILIVDDLAPNRLVLRRLLKKVDCEVFEAESGNDALGLCLEHRFALILLDINMPEMDGYEVAHILHSDEDTAQMPIVFVTAAHGDDLNRLKAYEVGAVDYLFKPIDDNILLAKVNVFLQLEQHRLQLQDALKDLNQLSEHNRLILDSTSHAVISVNASGEITLANPASLKILDINAHKLEGKQIARLFNAQKNSAGRRQWEHSELAQALCSATAYENSGITMYRQNGKSFPAELSFAPFANTTDQYTGGVIHFQDITERKWAENELIRLAKEDPLTQLPNRALFNDYLEKEISRCLRHNLKMALFFLDLDHFKQINDSLGHDAGDRLLVSVTKRMQGSLRKGDVIARLGGDEFAVLMPNLSDMSESTHVAEKMIKIMERPHTIGNRQVTVSFSIGVVVCPDAGDSTAELLKAADTAMYHAKEQGRNNYQYFEKKMQEMALLRSQLEEDLKLAIHNREFLCHYQPQIDTASGRTVAMEALVRWQSPKRGLVPPSDFIPIAEEIGAILSIGEQVMINACENLKALKSNGLMRAEDRIAVNISIHQLRRGNLVETVKKVLINTSTRPEELELEVTESTVMDNPETAIRMLTELRDMGIRISVDDFGTGYSSLMYLKQLPISNLKIDRGFVNDIGRDKNDEAIVLATINLAHSLGLTVTAEGVETPEQAAFLTQLNCDFLQGYYYSRPLSETDIANWLSETQNNPLQLANP